MTQTYLLEWLDSVVTSTLNPRKNDVNQITSVQSKTIIEKATQETQLIQSQITIQIFSLTKEKQIKVLVGNYHSALIILLDNLIANNNAINLETDDLKEVTDTLLSCLDELLTFVESRFDNFLSLDSRMPVTYLAISKKKIKQKLDKLKNSLISNAHDEKVIDIVFDNLYSFANSKKNKKVTFRQVMYRKQLIKELESLKTLKKEENTPSTLEALLIYMNFNSRTFIGYFTQSITDKISTYETPIEKMENLLFYIKEFNQIHSKDGVNLNPHHQDLKKVLSDWFKQEIIFLEKQQHLSLTPLQSLSKKPYKSTLVNRTEDKILCRLSTDQTALILRASNELKILISKSMNQVFKTIVPYLSTPNKSILSYDSMRSKSYVAEERDKELAIEALQHIIKKIQSY
ncbi:hypothetical protein [Flavobacterium sp. AED]|jgi:hypothetical protein|uniref:hypothetical protein n=1 Tax=Flavobacterium sp. AED TaxID=1423323 RepID=UPI00057D0317|nr:hypothetical protein [Flavobacterium sp. AED]KIA82437.1 hypothetical protein OA85_16355 [Flavobacterium sp. AED]